MESKRKNSFNNLENEPVYLNEISNNIVEEDKMHLFKFENLFKILEEKYSDLIGKIYEIFNFAEKKKKENAIQNNLNLSDSNNIKKSLFNLNDVDKVEKEWQLYSKLFLLSKSKKECHVNFHCSEKDYNLLLSLLKQRKENLKRYSEMLNILKNKQNDLKFTKEISIIEEIS